MLSPTDIAEDNGIRLGKLYSREDAAEFLGVEPCTVDKKVSAYTACRPFKYYGADIVEAMMKCRKPNLENTTLPKTERDSGVERGMTVLVSNEDQEAWAHQILKMPRTSYATGT